jgi:hypothetical protein
MPLDGRWTENDVRGLTGLDASIARLTVVLAKAPYRLTTKQVEEVMGKERDEERFVRILAWSSFIAARRFAQLVARRASRHGPESTATAAESGIAER